MESNYWPNDIIWIKQFNNIKYNLEEDKIIVKHNYKESYEIVEQDETQSESYN